jgi:hypothetical protein
LKAYLINLYFVDDTLLFLEAKTKYIKVLKLILIAFEDLFGLKINFDKCKIVLLNILNEEGSILAQILGCKFFYFSIAYLGVPLYFKTLTREHWNFLLEKIENKLQGPQGKLFSIGGRVT